MDIEYVRPSEIEKRSFEIISRELKDRGIMLDERYAPVIKRCIHTTADFDYADTLVFSKDALDVFKSLIVKGAAIVTDTNMALSGINKKELEKYGCSIHCFMADEDIADEAVKRGVTRASVSMEKAMTMDKPVIFVIGNAPTALITLRESYDRGYRPAFIVGVPVGFVNVEAAKELIINSDIDHVINRGRKGGSNVAAAICNALLYMMRDGLI